MTEIRVLPLGALLGALCVSTGPIAAQEQSWNRTLERIASGVVSIQIDSTRAFDTERNQSSQATGFVVDAERGLILTNRHVVTPGPVRAQAVFLNQEEVELQPVYRDPVHDFGFFRYDPSELQFMKPTELALVPEGAQVGRVRVVGNDAGEQFAILAALRGSTPRRATGAQLQRLQHLLSASRVGHFGRLVGLAGRRHRGPRRRAERRRELAGGLELLPAARSRRGRARGHPSREARAARYARDRVRAQAVRRAAAPGTDARHGNARAPGVPAADGPARRRASDSGVGGREQARARRRAHRGRRQAHRRVRAARSGARRCRGPRGQRRRRARRAAARDAREGRQPARHHARRVHRVRRRRLSQALVSAGAAFLSAGRRRLRRESRLRLRQGRDPARQHRDRYRRREARRPRRSSARARSRCQTTRRCLCAS